VVVVVIAGGAGLADALATQWRWPLLFSPGARGVAGREAADKLAELAAAVPGR
jgi:hypothetical protein